MLIREVWNLKRLMKEIVGIFCRYSLFSILKGERDMVWLIVVIYIIIYMILGIYATYKTNQNKTQDSFLVASRSLTWPVIALSAFATAVGGTATLGQCNDVFTFGLTACSYGFSRAFATFLLAFTFKKLTKVKVNNPNELLGIVFNKRDNWMFGLVLGIALIGVLGAQIMAGVSLLNSFVPGINKNLATLICAIGFGIFALLGGTLAGSLTNVLNTSVILVGLVFCAFLGVNRVGGFESIMQNLEGTAKVSFIGIGGISGFLTPFVINGFANWCTSAEWIQWRSGKDEKNSKIGFLISGVGQIVLSLIIGVIGLVGATIFKDYSGQGILMDVAQYVNPIIYSLVAIALFATIISTASAQYIAIPAVIISSISAARNKKFTEKQEFYLMRGLIAALIALVYVVALRASSIISLALTVNVVFVPFSLLVVCIFMWPSLLRKSTATVLTISSIIGFVLYNVFKLPFLVNIFPHAVWLNIMITVFVIFFTNIFDKRPATVELAYED